jgi:hypothetical protein
LAVLQRAVGDQVAEDNRTTADVPDFLKQLHDRADAAGMNPEIRRYVMDNANDVDMVLEFKRGRTVRRVAVEEHDAWELLQHDFEQISFIERYDAHVNRATGVIEAVLGGSVSSRVNGPVLARLAALPGVEVLSEGATPEAEGGDEPPEGPPEAESYGRSLRSVPAAWRLRVQAPGDAKITIELGTPSSVNRALMWGARATLKITGADVSTHDLALAALERYGNALLFEIDLIYALPLRLASQRNRTRRPLRASSELPPQFPRNKYAQQSLALYQYGRSASNLPLLEFLAYYQAVEYFFPYFAKEQMMLALRSTLLHPGFNPSSDTDIARVMDLSANGGRSALPEREQLRASVRACVVEADLAAIVSADKEIRKHFYDKRQVIRGVEPLREGAGANDLRDQVADRLYAIRCRIVHAKLDGGGSRVDVLLPLSEEADALAFDIEVMRFISQQALVGRAARS